MRAALCVLLALLAIPPRADAARPHVYLVVVDGLDARLATPERMPALFALRAHEPKRTTVYPAGLAVMPTRTNPNHASLLTGVFAETHGITGNAYWPRRPGASPEKLDDAALLEVETLFTVIESTRPALRTAGVFGKPKLARLFGAAPDRQRAPDVLWSPEALDPALRDPASGYSRDVDTVAAVQAAIDDGEPDLTFVNLSGVDRAAHADGPDSPGCLQAVADADAAIARLVDALHADGRWRRSVLFVTADHGFAAVAPTPERPAPAIAFGRLLADSGARDVRFVADGGVGYVYAEELTARATVVPTPIVPALARAVELARATPGIAEVLARLPLPGVPVVGSAHPDWRLAHERTGELLLVAAVGYQLVDPSEGSDRLRGNHGGPYERRVPFVVAGGWPGLVHARDDAPLPRAVDVAPTIARLLNVRLPRRVDGAALSPDAFGRPLAEAFRVRLRARR